MVAGDRVRFWAYLSIAVLVVVGSLLFWANSRGSSPESATSGSRGSSSGGVDGRLYERASLRIAERDVAVAHCLRREGELPADTRDDYASRALQVEKSTAESTRSGVMSIGDPFDGLPEESVKKCREDVGSVTLDDAQVLVDLFNQETASLEAGGGDEIEHWHACVSKVAPWLSEVPPPWSFAQESDRLTEEYAALKATAGDVAEVNKLDEELGQKLDQVAMASETCRAESEAVFGVLIRELNLKVAQNGELAKLVDRLMPVDPEWSKFEEKYLEDVPLTLG